MAASSYNVVYLLFVTTLDYLNRNTEALELPQAQIRVNTAVITERDSVLLSCEAPQSISVHQCHFYIEEKPQSTKHPACQRYFTGTELLQWKSLPSTIISVVNLKCFYTVHSGDVEPSSPHSNRYSVTLLGELPQPTVRVKPSFIELYESVQLSCDVPPSVSQCTFYIAERAGLSSELTPSNSACQRSLSGSELLRGRRGGNVTVMLGCYYTVKLEDSSLESPHSHYVEVEVRSEMPPPRLTVKPAVTPADGSVQLKCEAPPSVPVTQCVFFTDGGERTYQPSVLTRTPSECQCSFTGAELLRGRSLSADTEVKLLCFYTVKIKEQDEPSIYSNYATVTVKGPPSSTQTPRKHETSKPGTDNVTVGVASAVAVILLGVTVHCLHKRHKKQTLTRERTDLTNNSPYSLVTMPHILPAANTEVISVSPQTKPEDHVYSTIDDVPSSVTKESMVYSTLQMH
ncbi:hypothetical protein MATL_G00255390 [Megalops atlanticus]|uniref:Ig-like domain-containing protein n=1 Tax=Megalops atlanticus TaxID=7932 RepID=A0A9D3PDJ9_MEGAT|nr:hypothetical protein MATL_G00255390 [Megalops atlanticus]